MSNASDDFPDPDTPVTTVSRPTGMSTSKPCKLCSRAPTIRMTAGADMAERTNLQKRASQDYVVAPIALRDACRSAAPSVDRRCGVHYRGRMRRRSLALNAALVCAGLCAGFV